MLERYEADRLVSVQEGQNQEDRTKAVISNTASTQTSLHPGSV